MSFLQNLTSVFCRPIATGELVGWTNTLKSAFNSVYLNNGYTVANVADFLKINSQVFYPDIYSGGLPTYLRLAGDGFSQYDMGALSQYYNIWSRPSGQSWYVEPPYFPGNSQSLNVVAFYSQIRSEVTEQHNTLYLRAKINNQWMNGSVTGYKDLYTTAISGFVRGYIYNFPYVGPSGDFSNLQIGFDVSKLTAQDYTNENSSYPVGWLYDIYAEVVTQPSCPIVITGVMPYSDKTLNIAMPETPASTNTGIIPISMVAAGNSMSPLPIYTVDFEEASGQHPIYMRGNNPAASSVNVRLESAYPFAFNTSNI